MKGNPHLILNVRSRAYQFKLAHAVHAAAVGQKRLHIADPGQGAWMLAEKPCPIKALDVRCGQIVKCLQAGLDIWISR